MPIRLVTINIRNYLSKQPRRKRVMRISRYIKLKIAQSTNIKSDNIKIDKALNSTIMKKYLHSMKPIKLSINVEKEKATVTHFDDKPKQAAAPAATAAKPAATKQQPSAAAQQVQKASAAPTAQKK